MRHAVDPPRDAKPLSRLPHHLESNGALIEVFVEGEEFALEFRRSKNIDSK